MQWLVAVRKRYIYDVHLRTEEMKDIVIYTRDFCGYSSAALKLLESKGVPFTHHNATMDPELAC